MHQLQKRIKDSPDVYAVLREQIEHWRTNGEILNSQLVTFVNPYSYMLLRQDVDLCKALDAIYCDAISSARFSSLCLGKTIPRISFDYGSLAKTFFAQMNRYAIPVYFLGSNQPSLDKAVLNITAQYPDLNIVGQQHGYLSSEDEKSVIEHIFVSGAQFVIIGMGTPRQEQMGLRIIERFRRGEKAVHCFTCGGFLTQTSEQLAYYPQWINRLHLRWLWRLFKEKHVLFRLLREYPKFLLTFIHDLNNKYSTKSD